MLLLTALAGGLFSQYARGGGQLKTTSGLPHPVTPGTQEIGVGLSAQEFARAISERLMRVKEFQVIRQEAAKRGLRVWLFGGTAAGFAHYVKWDLLRQKGDPRFQPDRFDYDYTNIYRSTQDLDIVVDGGSNQVWEFQKFLEQNFSYFQGSKAKSAWEVRSLKEDIGDKQALLNNPDFLNQHTDSNSTGMIEITETPPSAAVKDLRDWKSPENHFLEDVIRGKLHYYYSDSHGTTSRFKDGMNPPLISVIRYLTKAFQYELQIGEEDLVKIKKVIDELDPSTFWQSERAKNSSYVRKWLENNGPKMIQHAVNIEYAWDTLEALGLRKKLIDLSSDTVKIQNSLAWWMDKEPLRSHEVGKGPAIESSRRATKETSAGSTAREIAKELGVDSLVVAHEANTFLAYESITRAHTGEPNVLISRGGKTGETAALGDGFYTRLGRQGARGTGLTIRFHVDPDAREGIDFTRSGDYLVFLNKKALRVIPETLNIGIVEYFSMLARGEALGVDDKGILEKLKRRIGNRLATLDPRQMMKVDGIIRRSAKKGGTNDSLFGEWLNVRVRYSVAKGQIKHARSYMDFMKNMAKLGSQFLPESTATQALLKGALLTMDFFMSLHPRKKQIEEMDKLIPGADYKRRYVQSRAEKAANIHEFFEALEIPPQTAPPPLPTSWRTTVLRTLQGKFFSLNPSIDDILRVSQLPAIDDILHNNYVGRGLTQAQSNADILRLLKGGRNTLNGGTGGNVAKLITNNIDLFFSFHPSIEEVAEFMPWFTKSDLQRYVTAAIQKIATDAEGFLQLVTAAAATDQFKNAQQFFDSHKSRFFGYNPTVQDFIRLPPALMVDKLNDTVARDYIMEILPRIRSPQELMQIARWSKSLPALVDRSVAKLMAGPAYCDVFFGFHPSNKEKKELLDFFMEQDAADGFVERLVPTLQSAEEYGQILKNYLKSYPLRMASPLYHTREHLLKLRLSPEQMLHLLQHWDESAANYWAERYLQTLGSAKKITRFLMLYGLAFDGYSRGKRWSSRSLFGENESYVLSKGFGIKNLIQLLDNDYAFSHFGAEEYVRNLVFSLAKTPEDYIEAAALLSRTNWFKPRFERGGAYKRDVLGFFKNFMQTRPDAKQVQTFLVNLGASDLDSQEKRQLADEVYFDLMSLFAERAKGEDLVEILKRVPLSDERMRKMVDRILFWDNSPASRRALKEWVQDDFQARRRLLVEGVLYPCELLLRSLGDMGARLFR